MVCSMESITLLMTLFHMRPSIKFISLNNVYLDKKTAKKLWESLDWKYKTEDDGAKKFVVDRFLDSKTVIIGIVKHLVKEIALRMWFFSFYWPNAMDEEN